MRAGKTVVKIAAGLLLVLSIALPLLIPVFVLPPPGGPHAIGTTAMVFTDPERPETMTPQPDDTRRLLVHFWYPAEPSPDKSPTSYWTPGQARRFSPLLAGDTYPSFLFRHLHLCKTNSYEDAPFPEGQNRFPVVLFSSGGGRLLTDNLIQIEELASHGYLVIGVTHPYFDMAVSFPDGALIPRSRDHEIRLNEQMEEVQESAKLYFSSENLGPGERRSLATRLLDGLSERVMASGVRAEDVRSVLDLLEILDSGEIPSIFENRLDSRNIGVFGWSGGGDTAATACAADHRLKAGISLDGFHYGISPGAVISQPFMIMYGEPTDDANEFMYHQFADDLILATVRGASHVNYGNDHILSPIAARLGFLGGGTIRADRMMRIVNSFVTAFFGHYLREKETDLLAGPTPLFPEVTVRRCCPD